MNKFYGFLFSRIKAFRNAFAGIGYVIRTQRNAWIHAISTILVIFVCLWVKIDHAKWAIIFLTITTVWAAEFINTALEAVVDLSSPQKHPLAKIGKDVGAAAVLIATISAVIIGLLIIGPPLFQKITPIINALRF